MSLVSYPTPVHLSVRLSLCAEVCGEHELRGSGPEQTEPLGENPLPALRSPGLEPQRLAGPQSGGVRMFLQ